MLVLTVTLSQSRIAIGLKELIRILTNRDRVLILVVMDVALGQDRQTIEKIFRLVLILVVMDVALGQSIHTTNRHHG